MFNSHIHTFMLKFLNKLYSSISTSSSESLAKISEPVSSAALLSVVKSDPAVISSED